MRALYISLIVIALFVRSTSCTAQQVLPNLDMEKVSTGKKLPDGWFVWGTGYEIEADSGNTRQGKYAIRIQAPATKRERTFGSAVYQLPAVYEGKEIELRGLMKMEQVDNGFAGLLLRIDSDDKSLEFSNMQDQDLKGTHRWSTFSIKLPYPGEAKRIYAGALLTGTGTVWIDHLELFIDGKSLRDVPRKAVKTYAAAADTAFSRGSGITSIPITTKKRLT